MLLAARGVGLAPISPAIQAQHVASEVRHALAKPAFQCAASLHFCCTCSEWSGLAEMPKKATARIGYWRPKKRPISEESEPSEEPSITNDLEAIPEEVAPVPPEAGLSAMSITDGGSNDVPPQERQENQESKLKAEWKKALRKAAVVELAVVGCI